MEEAERLCDRVAIIAGGRIRAEGALDALKAETGKDLEEVFVAMVESSIVT